MIEKIIKVQIDNFEVDQEYYSFDYKIYIDDELVLDDEYSDDHEWEDDIEGFKEMMLGEENEAVKLALGRL